MSDLDGPADRAKRIATITRLALLDSGR